MPLERLQVWFRSDQAARLRDVARGTTDRAFGGLDALRRVDPLDTNALVGG